MALSSSRYFNRELSWLQFNARVLQEAADLQVPLINRLRFIGIFSNNLDEFFMVRYATVRRVALSHKSEVSTLGANAIQLLDEINKRVYNMQKKSLQILNQIQEDLKEENIFFITEKEVTPKQINFIKTYFLEKVSPALVTIILDEDTDLRLKDGSAYLAIKLVLKNIIKADTSNSYVRYALVEIPRSVNRFVVFPKTENCQYVMMLDDLIRYCLDSIFNIFEYSSISAHMIKVTLDAELDIKENDLSKSIIQKISIGVKERTRSEAVRFIYDSDIAKDTLNFLLRKMNIDDIDNVTPGGRYHYRKDYIRFPSLNRPDLLYKNYTPLHIKGLSLEGSLLQKIRLKDYLQYTPYNTFSYIIRFLREAALDPRVKSIKITAYRLAHLSHVVSSLVNAVKNGKAVTILIELQARFDEEANINHAEILQSEGVNVIFGIPGLKVHAKICLITRKEERKNIYYGFISTGNLNESTAKVYTDFTLFTTNQKILKEVNKVFDFFGTNYRVYNYKHLIVSPHYSKKKFQDLIKQEIKNVKSGNPAYIKLKLNNLSSHAMINELYKASCSGVKIQMIIRGVCCLIPGIKGMSENIEVISVVDKFLEHPRLYIFCNDNNPKVYISSADWMKRNIEYRVEVSCPIYDKDIKKELIDTFNISWSDNVKARIISEKQDNTYKENNKKPCRSQFETYNYYLNKINEH